MKKQFVNKHNAKIIIAAHKPYRMPEDPMYVPVHVGASGKDDIGFVRDDSGDNISELNPEFCELTGFYWAWKNLDADYIGLVHYRRYFGGKKRKKSFVGKSGREKDPMDSILNSRELDFLLDRYKIVVPYKRRYVIESLYSHYIHTHQADELDKTGEIIEESFPDYKDAYDKVMKRTWGYMFNMMIMNRELLEDYCTWLFDILYKLRDKVDTSDRTDFEKRYVGRISELLFNVWLEKKLETEELSVGDIAELPLISIEKENYFKKGKAFLAAKFFGKKQTKSF